MPLQVILYMCTTEITVLREKTIFYPQQWLVIMVYKTMFKCVVYKQKNNVIYLPTCPGLRIV